MRRLKHLPLTDWPEADTAAFAKAYQPGDIFDETNGPGAHHSEGCIEDGRYSRALADRLAELERQRDLIEARQVENPAATIRLHPRLADVYAEKVQRLEEALNDPSIRDEAAEILRSLIDCVELRPRDDGQGLDALLYGDLAEILGFCGTDTKRKLPEGIASGSQLSVVAGAGNHLNLQLRLLTSAALPPRFKSCRNHQ